MRSHTVQYAIPGSAILRMCRPTLSSFPSSSPTFSDGHNSQFHAFVMFSLNGSPRSTTICFEAMLDVKPHNALRSLFRKPVNVSSIARSATAVWSETDLKYFFGFRFFSAEIFFKSGNTVHERPEIPLTHKLPLQFYCQAPGITGHCWDWPAQCQYTVTGWDRKFYQQTFISVWQHIKVSEQIHPWDTLACYWDVQQPTTISPLQPVQNTCQFSLGKQL